MGFIWICLKLTKIKYCMGGAFWIKYNIMIRSWCKTKIRFRGKVGNHGSVKALLAVASAADLPQFFRSLQEHFSQIILLKTYKLWKTSQFFRYAFLATIALKEFSLIIIPAPCVSTFKHHDGHMTKNPKQSNIHVLLNNSVCSIVPSVINLT